MREKLTRNLGLKIVSVLVAVILWLLVVNIIDPVETKTFSSIQVTIQNEEAITEKGKVYEVIDGSDISIKVTAPRSILDELKTSDFSAVADLEETTDWDTVDIDVTSNRYADQIEEIEPVTKTLKVSIEDSATKQFAINVVTSGTQGEGYAIGESTCTPNIVRISGPASVVNKVSKVVTEVKVEGMTSMIKDYESIELYDSNGEEVSSSSLEYSVDEVFVTVTMLKTKEVPLEYIVTGEPADGYQYTGLESVPDTVTIAGTSSTLADIDSIPLEDEVIDITDAEQSVQKVIDISQYLPDDVKLADSSEVSVLVTANIEKLVTKDFEIPYDELSIENLSSGYVVDFDTDEENFLVTIQGLSEDVDEVTLDSLDLSLDLDGYGLGTYNVTLDMTLPDNVTWESDSKIRLKIRSKETSSSSTSEASS